MTYGLAKQLKDAGYPQKYHPFTGLIYEENGTMPIHHSNDKGCYCPDCIGEPFCIVPTLSELIEACGDEFERLDRYKTTDNMGKPCIRWRGVSTQIMMGGWETPEEAVARLWLALNANPKDSLT